MKENMKSLPWSFSGGVSRLYESDGDLYRIVEPQHAEFYRRLFNEGIIQQLIDEGFFVESQIVTSNESTLILRHRLIPLISYVFEWCDDMLFDASRFFLRFNRRLQEFGLMVKDAHPWNILFDRSAPVFIDLGSIVPASNVDLLKFEFEFQTLFIKPLKLYAEGYQSLARALLREWRMNAWTDLQGYSDDADIRNQIKKKLKTLTPDSIWGRLSQLRSIGAVRASRKLLNPTDAVRIDKVLDKLERELGEVRLNYKDKYPDYYDTFFSFPSFDSTKAWNQKHLAISRMLDNPQIRSVMDLGSNRGWYSLLAATRGKQVVAIDSHEPAIKSLYAVCKDRKLNLLPLHIDLVWPSPAYGLMDFWPSAYERFQSDVVLGLALIHHLVHSEGLWFEQIISGISRFSRRWLILEFVPYDDPLLSEWKVTKREWYNLEYFCSVLRKRFEIIETAESFPSQRTLIFCERRDE